MRESRSLRGVPGSLRRGCHRCVLRGLQADPSALFGALRGDSGGRAILFETRRRRRRPVPQGLIIGKVVGEHKGSHFINKERLMSSKKFIITLGM